MAESSNGNGNGDLRIQMPMWLRIFFQVGGWTGLALVLLAAQFGWLRTPMLERMERMEYQAWQQTTILRTICYALNTTGRGCEPWKASE